MEDIRAEKVLDAICMAVCDSDQNGLCKGCPVIQMIRDVRDSMREKNNQSIAAELGIEFDPTRCPCIGEFKNRQR